MPFVTVDDVRLFYTDEGDGNLPLLFVHGWTCDSHDWLFQLPAFTDHRVIALDLRGHGRSSVPDDGYTTKRFADDIVAVLDHVGAERVVAIGHSMGGAIVTALAVEHPTRVVACVNVDPALGLPEQAGAALHSSVMGLDGADGPRALAAVFAAMSNEHTPGHLVSWHAGRAMGCSPHVARQSFDNLWHGPQAWGLRPACDEYLARRSCPTLAVYADEARAACESAALDGPHDELVVWPGVGHWLHQERPDEFNALLRRWLGRTRLEVD